jgi:SAM-dependent methyltransferase
MVRDIDVLAAPTLKNLRTRWWDDAFTAFVRDTVQPRAGRRILDIGCGIGTAEVNLGRLPLTQVTLIGVDRVPDRVREALGAVRSHNIRASFAAADACALPFADATFDSSFCVALLQHIADVAQAVREITRVTRPGGRIVAVEPDNSARYFYSSSPAGMRAYELAGQFFSGLSERGDATDPAVGPKLPSLFANSGIQLLNVQLFPVSRAQLGAPAPAVWAARRQTIEQAITAAGDVGLRRLGQDYLKLLDTYAEEAKAAGPAFVELQNTMLFATVGQKQE